VRTRHGRADLPDLQSWAGRVLADQEGVGMTGLAAEVRPMISAASGTLATARTRLANMGWVVVLLTVGSSGLVKPGSVSGWCSGQRPTCPLLHEAALRQNGIGTPSYLSFHQAPLTLCSLKSPSLGISSLAGSTVLRRFSPGRFIPVLQFKEAARPGRVSPRRYAGCPRAPSQRHSRGSAEEDVVPGSEPSSGRPSYPRRLRSKFGFGLIKAVCGEG
jgi:hypothetical protein